MATKSGCSPPEARSTSPFPVLTDLDNGYALSLNLAIWLGAEIQRLLSNQNLARFHGNDGWVLPIPATFVVGRDGLVKARFVDPDFRRRMEIDDLLAALAARQEQLARRRCWLRNCCQSAPRSIRIIADATAVRSRPGDAIEMDGAPGIQPIDRGAFQRVRHRRGVRDHGNADIRFEQLDQVALDVIS